MTEAISYTSSAGYPVWGASTILALAGSACQFCCLLSDLVCTALVHVKAVFKIVGCWCAVSQCCIKRTSRRLLPEIERKRLQSLICGVCWCNSSCRLWWSLPVWVLGELLLLWFDAMFAIDSCRLLLLLICVL